MANSNENLVSEATLSRLWQRIPLAVRAVITGFLVYAIGGLVAWIAVLTIIPIPWSLVVMWLVLWLYLKYFSGSWWPKTTVNARAERFRATKLSPRTWRWSLATALFIVVVIESSLVVTFRIVKFPAEAWAIGLDTSAFPLWMVWLYIILTASVVGITEEVGFRGYMQLPLEKRYGPVAGIGFVAIMFAVFHLNQAWAPIVLFHLFLCGVMWGTLAYASGSLIPGILSHIVGDIFSFSYWWTDVAGSFDKQPIAETGIDGHFIAWTLILVLSIILCLWAMKKILAARGSQDND
jgi:membrane protease YdiL (CAAX protease family)